MTQWLTLLWHRHVLRHRQNDIDNGATEPGVECWRPPSAYEREAYSWAMSDAPWKFCRWFPSDGGGGK